MSGVRAGFAEQAEACESLGSPLMARLCRLAAERLSAETVWGEHILSWPGESSYRGDALALRLMGSLHRLVLEGKAPALKAAYDAPALFSDDALWQLITETAARHEVRLIAGLSQPPQTNELRRSVALAAIGHWLSARYGLPLVISELGASAGLNLYWAEWHIETPVGPMGPPAREAPVRLSPEWRGQPPVRKTPQIREARGVDLAPADPMRDRLKLLSYIWPDQSDRLERTSAALDHLAARGACVDQGDAIGWLEARLATARPGALHLVCHTIAWQYFPEASRMRGEALLAAAGARATAEAPLARFAMEADDSGLPGAALTLDLWAGDLRPGGQRLAFGRADFHGRWIEWQPPVLPGR